MNRWEIKVYGFGIGHLYTMYSSAKFESVKTNMMKRFKAHKEYGVRVGMIVIRDLEELTVVHVREIMRSGEPRYRRWRTINYSEKVNWDNAVNIQMKEVK